MSIPLAAYIFLAGLFWPAKPLMPPHPDDYDDALEAEAAERDYRKAQRRRAIISIVRGLLLLVGGLFLLIGLIGGPGEVQDTGGLTLLLGFNGVLILLVQRAEVNRRLATLAFMAFCGIVVQRYAAFRNLDGEENWSIYAALALNYAFWLIVGRRYPPGSSEDIVVWGMDG